MEELYDETREYQSEIKNIILTKKNEDDFQEILEEFHMYDISQVVIELEPEEKISFFNHISPEFSASVLEFLEEEDAFDVIRLLETNKVAKIIANMDIDDAVDLLKHSGPDGMKYLRRIEAMKRKEIAKIMAYEEDEIGAFMSDSFIKLEKDMNVKEAMKKVVDTAHDTDYISILYIEENKKLVGYLRLKDLIVARASESISDIMESRFEKALPHDDKEDVAQKMQGTSESSIPIVDEDDKLLGIITHDDLIDIIALSQEEDYNKFAAIADIEIDIKTLNLKRSVKSRLPWLIVLLALGMITSIILAFFDAQLSGSDDAKLLASRLAIYLPLLSGMSGNTGTQSLAVMIRYLTKNKERDRFVLRKHLFKEFKTGFTQGIMIGVLVFAMVNITTLIRNDGVISNTDFVYSIVPAISIFIAFCLSTTNGALIPIVLEKLKIDPAVASGPLISTVSDIITLSIYYSLSLIILLPLFTG